VSQVRIRACRRVGAHRRVRRAHRSDVNARTIACAEAIQSFRLVGVRDVVPTTGRLPSTSTRCGPTPTLDAPVEQAASAPRRCIGGARPDSDSGLLRRQLGPDLGTVAAFAGMPEDEVVRVHASTTVPGVHARFVAGFAYLGIVDPHIAAAAPFDAAGARADRIGGDCGDADRIYPAETPGGWQLIGRTPLKAVRSIARRSISDEGGRFSPVLSHRAGRIRPRGGGRMSGSGSSRPAC